LSYGFIFRFIELCIGFNKGKREGASHETCGRNRKEMNKLGEIKKSSWCCSI